jgi:23S rRNA (guanosine2251-2'-O)-methyltransferase
MSEKNKQEMVYGVHPLQQALALGRRECYKIVLEKGKPPARLAPLLELAETHGTRMETLPPEVFRKKYGKLNHQGVVGYFSPLQTLELETLIEQVYQSGSHPSLVLADEIQDPQNLGALIRSAWVLGLQGLILPRHRRWSHRVAPHRLCFQPETGGGNFKRKRILDRRSGYGG